MCVSQIRNRCCFNNLSSKKKKENRKPYFLFIRYWGEEDDHISVASRKMINYAKTDCVGASKGLFFGLITLICGLICLVLFFVLIQHDNEQVRGVGKQFFNL